MQGPMLVLKGVHNRKELLRHSSLGKCKPLLLQHRDLCICFRKLPVERISNHLQHGLFGERPAMIHFFKSLPATAAHALLGLLLEGGSKEEGVKALGPLTTKCLLVLLHS